MTHEFHNEAGASLLEAVSNAVVRLHKEQFGRGPANSRAFFAGPNAIVCVLHDALLPAERKLVGLGQQERVRESRVAYQAATQDEFVSTIELITGRKVVAFGSSVDPDTATVFENFELEPRPADGGSA